MELKKARGILEDVDRLKRVVDAGEQECARLDADVYDAEARVVECDAAVAEVDASMKEVDAEEASLRELLAGCQARREELVAGRARIEGIKREHADSVAALRREADAWRVGGRAHAQERLAAAEARVPVARARIARAETAVAEVKATAGASPVMKVVHTSLGGKPTNLLLKPRFQIIRTRSKFSR